MPETKAAGTRRSPRETIRFFYERPIRSTRGGALFNAFPYPTKISPEAIALFIATHTPPGATVFDGFAGSGTTGLGAILCASPSDGMKREAKRLGLPVRWGPRRAVLYELGVLGSFIARTLCSPPESGEFRRAAEQLLDDVVRRHGWVYETTDPSGATGTIRYVVWSDVLRCPSCRKYVSLWDACVSREPAQISRTFGCPNCGHRTDLCDVQRVRESVTDDPLGEDRRIRRRQPAWVYGGTAGKSWSREASSADLRLLQRIESEPIPPCVPRTVIPWGDLHRSGYHEGMTHLHHFYTRRNLISFGSLWSEVQRHPQHLRDALRFWLLSYNSAHTTIMTRVVAKKGQRDLVVTSAQPGVLYVSGLPVEKNVFAGLRRKLSIISRAFELIHGHGDMVRVHNASCLSVGLPTASVDYVFTDPPFAGNIPYAEVNFVNEAWLGQTTDQGEEAIVSNHQGKTVDDYQDMLLRALREVHRILRPDGKATVVFHSASARVWNALRDACDQAGLRVARTSILDKTQGSFKQVTAQGAVRGDPLILLTKDATDPDRAAEQVWVVTDNLLRQASLSTDPAEMTPQRVYSRLAAHYVSCHQEVPIDAGEFYVRLAERQAAYANAVM